MPTPEAPPDPDALHHSWDRSRAHGLAPDAPLDDSALAPADLGNRLYENGRLLALSRPVIEGLYRQIGRPSSTVLLADNKGLILSTVGHMDFLERAQTVALRPGVDWSEPNMGTNAIGTALKVGGMVTVQGREHYLERNRILACVATPILAPSGGMLGILDVSSDASADLTHTRALLRTTAELIEYRLLEHLERGFLTLHFDLRADALALPMHGLTVFDEEGVLLASNRSARTLLGPRDLQHGIRCETCFGTPWSGIVSRAAQEPDLLFPLPGLGGRRFVARASLRSRRRMAASAPPAHQRREESRLGAMLLGDVRIRDLVETLHECAPANTPLIVEGEMGTGKAYLIRAFHADHCASPDAPLIGVDCNSLPTDEHALTEALDTLWTQAANGTLALVEFDLLPIGLQERLCEANDGTRARIVGITRRPVAELERLGALGLTNFRANGGRLLSLPPLRERSDFDALVRQFVREAAPGRDIRVAPDAINRLQRYDWPGNVRELRNQLRLALALMGDDAQDLRANDVPEELFEADDSATT